MPLPGPWNLRTSPWTFADDSQAVWSDTLGLFVVLSRHTNLGTPGTTTLATSVDGITWLDGGFPFGETAFSGTIGLRDSTPRLVAGGGASSPSTSEGIFTSVDGATWTHRASNFDAHSLGPGASCYSPDLDTWVMGGLCGQASPTVDGTFMEYSNDNGVTWSPIVAWTTDISSYNGGATANPTIFPPGTTCTGTSGNILTMSNNSLQSGNLAFTIGGLAGIFNLPVSGNVITWIPFFDVHGIAWSSSLGMFAAIVLNTEGPRGSAIYTSTDGQSWTEVWGTPFDGHPVNFESIIWSNSLSKFVAVGSNAAFTRQIMSSADGATWTAVASDVFSGGQAMCVFEGPTALYIGGNPGSGTATVFSTSDLVNFHDEKCPLDLQVTSLVYTNSIPMLVAVGTNVASTNAIATASFRPQIIRYL